MSEDLEKGEYVVFIWDLRANADENRRALFYKKLAGYRTRKYKGTVGEKEAIVKRLQGYGLRNPQDIPPEALPDGIDGITPEGRLFKEYEYEGVLEEIPPHHKVRLNDSAYLIYSESAHKIRELLEDFEDIVKSRYEIHISWEQVEAIEAEGEIGFKRATLGRRRSSES